MSQNTAIGWTDATCRKCGDALTPENRVESGRMECKPCKNARVRARYVKRGHPGRRGWLAPEELPCTDCADHSLTPGGRHEYDHAKGYNAENQLYVEPVCQRCHRNREEARCG